MHQELSKDGEDRKLGDVKTTPLDQHTLGLHTSNFCFFDQCTLSHKLGASFICFLFWFDFLFVLRPPLSFIHDTATGNFGWIKLDAIKNIGKGMFELIQKDTYSCMIHGPMQTILDTSVRGH